tara:strand:- start:1032 stop:1595 length:564 start_codon:yes stop_codon:yes gene_type:complete
MKFTIIPSEQTPKLNPIEDVATFIADNKTLLEKFVSYTKDLESTVGLAANQVAVDDERITDRFCMVKTTDGWVCAIDPKIVNTIGMKKDVVEGCLTWGDKFDIITKRYPRIKVEYYDTKGHKKSRFVEDTFESQVWQHEINHLNGVEETIVPRLQKPETVTRSSVKIGRNDPCSCGSNIKYKKCCGK